MIRQAAFLLVLFTFLSSLRISNGTPVRNTRQSEDNDNNCAHPFHSFLCKKAPRSRIFNTPQSAGSAISNVVIVPTKPPQSYDPPFAGENSFLDPTFITTKAATTLKVATLRTTTEIPVPIISGDSSNGDPVFLRPKPTRPPLEAQAAVLNPLRSNSHDIELCSHPFHSFLCQPGRRSGSRRIITGKLPPSYKGENSFIDAVKIKPSTTLPPPPPPQIPEASFQSPTFYKPISSTTKRPTTTTLRPRPTTRKPVPIRVTTTTPQPQPEVPEASFDSPTFFKPETPRTTQPPRPTVRILTAAPQQIVTVTAQPEHYKGQDPCQHAFHSYLCQPGRGTRRRNYGKAPSQPAASNLSPAIIKPVVTTTTTREPEVPEYSFLDAVAIKPSSPRTTTSRPITYPPTTPRLTTTPRPITRQTTVAPIEAAPSSDVFSGFIPPKPIIQASANTVNNRVQAPEYDKCKHAFHSFLCQPTRPRKIQLQSAPSNIEGSLLLPAYRTTTSVRPTRPTTVPPTRPPRPPSTTRPPPQPTTQPPKPTTEEAIQVPDSSFQDPQRVAPPKNDPPPQEPVPAPTLQQNELLPAQFVRGPTEVTDKQCSHSFHGFLCKKAPRARRPIRIN